VFTNHCNREQKKNWLSILFVYKLCTESYGVSYADSDTCRRPLTQVYTALKSLSKFSHSLFWKVYLVPVSLHGDPPWKDHIALGALCLKRLLLVNQGYVERERHLGAELLAAQVALPGTRFTNFTQFLIKNPANFLLAPISGILYIKL
jgi:hypothetical protein